MGEPNLCYHVSASRLPPGTLLTQNNWHEHDAFGVFFHFIEQDPNEVMRLLRTEWQICANRNEPGFSGSKLFVYFKEAVFERIRQRDFEGRFPSLPRLASTFVFDDLNDAERYRSTHVPGGTIHACSCPDGSEAVAYDMTRFDKFPVNLVRPFDEQEAGWTDSVGRYFRGEASDSPVWERLTRAPVTVVGML